MEAYYSKKDLINAKNNDTNYIYDLTDLEEFLEYVPTADVVPRDEVERGVVEYIEKHLRYKRKMVDIPFTSRDMRNYQCGAIDVIEYFEELVNELKEKYTKGGPKDE